MRKDYIQVYKIVWNPDNTRTTEHRRIMENHLGRKLEYNEVVHHKNENKLDNRISNLEIKQRGAHTREHQKPASVVEKKCLFCGESISILKRRLDYRKRKTPYDYCNRSCAKAQWRRGAVSKNIGKWSKRPKKLESS